VQIIDQSSKSLDWRKSFLWLAVAVACFHAAYTLIQYPAAGLFIVGYALCLVKLTDQPNVRRAFYFGLAAGFLCFAPQLFFFWSIFSIAAIVLWLVLAFWVGLFAAIICGAIRRWGKVRAMWLVPFVWTGLEYFRSELYYLKFSWLNIGYALPEPIIHVARNFFGMGMYGDGFVVFFALALFLSWRQIKVSIIQLMLILLIIAVFMALMVPMLSRKPNAISIAGIQTEFPPASILPKALDKALKKNPDSQIFVLSEYTLDGAVPDSLKNWCHEHARFVVVGGKDFVTNDVYFNTVFVVGTNGEVVFKQAKSVPIQFFKDGLPALAQKVWNSPWGKIGICICYDLSYTRVTDELVRQGAQMLIVPTMDVEFWGRHQHELHSRVAPVRAAEYGIPIFRVASSGISQAVAMDGHVVAQTSMPGIGEIFSAKLRLPSHGSLPVDRWLAPSCTVVTGVVLAALLILAWKEKRAKN